MHFNGLRGRGCASGTIFRAAVELNTLEMDPIARNLARIVNARNGQVGRTHRSRLGRSLSHGTDH